MKRFNEGKACDAVLRYIEAREQHIRQNLRSPEQERRVAPIELTCSVGERLFALEHTGIESFDGQVAIEARADFKPLREIFSRRISTGEYYELHVASGATLDLSKALIERMTLALRQWIDSVGPTLSLTPLGLKGAPIVRQADSSVPFEVKLYRKSFPNPSRGLSVVHEVNNLNDLRLARIRRAYLKKLPKLDAWKAIGARTVLVLEAIDDQLTDPVEVARMVLAVEKDAGNAPHEVYFVMSASAPWWVWYVRVDNRSYFDLNDPSKRAWNIDPDVLLPITAR